MLYEFYNPYDIDDQNIGCGKIIQVGCDDTHRYVDPCSIVKSCITRPAIDWCAMIPGQVAGQPGIPSAAPGRILAVNNTGSCVEWIAPPNNDTDILVKVSSNDTIADYLQNKLITCDPTKIQISVQNEGANEKLVICSSFPTTFVGLTDTPNNLPTTCNAYVRANSTGLYYECERNYRAKMYLNSDHQRIQQNNIIETYRMNTPDFRGNPLMKYDHPTRGTVIIIPETGMYEVSGKTNARVNNGIQALRLFVSTSNTKLVLADAKFGGDDNPARAIIDTYKSKSTGYYEFYCGNIVKLNQGDYIWLDYKIDTNVESGPDGVVTFFSSVLAGNSNYNTGNTVKTPHGGTCISVKRYCKDSFNED